MSDLISNGQAAGRGAVMVMVATVMSNDSGAELRGSRSSQSTLDSVPWSNKPPRSRPETHGRRNSAGCCTAGVAGERLSCNSSAEWSPRTTSGPGPCEWVILSQDQVPLPPGYVLNSPLTWWESNGPRLGRMKGPIQRHYAMDMHEMYCIERCIYLNIWRYIWSTPPITTLLFKPFRQNCCFFKSFINPKSNKTDGLSKFKDHLQLCELPDVPSGERKTDHVTDLSYTI